MKISELIKQLKELERSHGDVEIIIKDDTTKDIDCFRYSEEDNNIVMYLYYPFYC